MSIGFTDTLSLAQTIGIVGTMILTLYFSKRQIQSLSVDTQTRIVNDLDEKIHELTRMGIERPELTKVISNVESDRSPDVVYAYHFLQTCAHAFDMHQRKQLTDNEWAGWLRRMKTPFEQGTIREIWKSNIEMKNWFDPDFQEFIDRELYPMAKE